MYRLAVVEDGVVSRVIVSSSVDQFPNTIDVTGTLVSAGWVYDGQIFSLPTIEETSEQEATLPYKQYSHAQFIDAVTRQEYLAFLTLAKTDVLLEMFHETTKARGYVDFNDEATRDSAPYLVQAGILTQERLNQLIGGPNGN